VKNCEEWMILLQKKLLNEEQKTVNIFLSVQNGNRNINIA